MDCAFGRTHPLSETVPDPVLLTERPTVSRAASATGTREDHITLDPAVNRYSHKWNRIWSNVQPDEPPGIISPKPFTVLKEPTRKVVLIMQNQ